MPVPKNRYQNRFAKTRAVSPPPPPGLVSTSQLARSRRVARRPAVSSDPRTSGMAGVTISPLSSSQLPRGRTRVVRGSSNATVTIDLRAFLRMCAISASSASVGISVAFAFARRSSRSVRMACSASSSTEISGGRFVGRSLVPTVKCCASSMSAKNAAIP